MKPKTLLEIKEVNGVQSIVYDTSDGVQIIPLAKIVQMKVTSEVTFMGIRFDFNALTKEDTELKSEGVPMG